MIAPAELSQSRKISAPGAPGAADDPRPVPTRPVPANDRMRSRPPALLLVSVLSATAAGILTTAWAWRPQHYLSPERGIGYALGIAGLTAMLLLLLYPLRKHGWLPARTGPLRRWFHFHMALGIIGPTCVLLHANFRLGSTNSTVALVSALIVASSGYFGRFVYSRIHIGLSGHRTRFSELCRTTRELRDEIGRDAQPLAREFECFEAWAMEPDAGIIGAFSRFVGSRRRIAALRARAETAVSDPAHPGFHERLTSYLYAAQRLARFRAYERMFGLWHGLHLPLSVFLYGASLVHVVAVHAY